jgi:hypoxanthine phosphoribosyltransferase
MGSTLADRYSVCGELHAITVLNGALHFASDLRRMVQASNPDIAVTSEQVQLKSYTNTKSGEVQCLSPMPDGLEGRHVLVIEDIFDSGRTLEWLIEQFRKQRPASLEVAVAVKRVNNDRRKDVLGGVAITSGFDINDDDFIVGYGLDIDEKYRDLSGIYKLIEVER